MAVVVTHSTPADGTFSATGAAAWNANHTLSGLGTMAEQDANNVNITGGSISGVTGVATSGTNSNITSLTGLTTPLSVAQGGSGTATPSLVAGTNITISGSWPNQTIATSGVLTGLTVNSTPTSGGAAGQIMFDTGSVLQESSNFVWNNANGGLTVSSIANPTIPSLTINGASNYTGATLSGVQITGTGGQFSCNATTLTVGEFLTISGTLGGTGSITGYSNPTTYRISATNGTTTFTLVNATSGAAIVTTSGTPTGLTYTVTDPFTNLSQTWNNSVVAFRGLQYNVTDTASNANSLLMDLQVGGTSQFSVNKVGLMSINNNAMVVGYDTANGKSTIRSTNDNTLSLQTGGDITFGSRQAAGNTIYGRFNSTGLSVGSTADTYLTRRGAANLRFGAADAAAPVAQTLSVQSVVAGTSNTAGANLTITGSQGTGTGAGGDIIFQTALAGTSGTAQNTLITGLRIYSNQTVAVGKAYTVATLPAAGTQGRRAWVTDALAPTFLGALTGGGAVVCPVFDNGAAWVAG